MIKVEDYVTINPTIDLGYGSPLRAAIDEVLPLLGDVGGVDNINKVTLWSLFQAGEHSNGSFITVDYQESLWGPGDEDWDDEHWDEDAHRQYNEMMAGTHKFTDSGGLYGPPYPSSPYIAIIVMVERGLIEWPKYDVTIPIRW